MELREWDICESLSSILSVQSPKGWRPPFLSSTASVHRTKSTLLFVPIRKSTLLFVPVIQSTLLFVQTDYSCTTYKNTVRYQYSAAAARARARTFQSAPPTVLVQYHYILYSYSYEYYSTTEKNNMFPKLDKFT